MERRDLQGMTEDEKREELARPRAQDVISIGIREGYNNDWALYVKRAEGDDLNLVLNNGAKLLEGQARKVAAALLDAGIISNDWGDLDYRP